MNEEVQPSLKAKVERAVASAIGGSVACVRFSSAGEYLAAGYNNNIGAWEVHV
jgi:hypothetical protein